MRNADFFLLRAECNLCRDLARGDEIQGHSLRLVMRTDREGALLEIGIPPKIGPRIVAAQKDKQIVNIA